MGTACFKDQQENHRGADDDSSGDERGQVTKTKGQKRVKVLLLGKPSIIFSCAVAENEYFFFSGAGEAGKSTMAKQMKIFHLKGFTEDELRQYKVQVHQNILKNMKTLVKGAEDRYIQIQNEVTVGDLVGRTFPMLIFFFFFFKRD